MKKEIRKKNLLKHIKPLVNRQGVKTNGFDIGGGWILDFAVEEGKIEICNS